MDKNEAREKLKALEGQEVCVVQGLYNESGVNGLIVGKLTYLTNFEMWRVENNEYAYVKFTTNVVKRIITNGLNQKRIDLC